MDHSGQSDHPLRTAADILPRARNRCAWCAAGLGIGFVLTGLWRGWGVAGQVWWAAFIVILLPAMGALQDWRRLKKEPNER